MAVAVSLAGAAAVNAETLDSALARAYAGNPGLDAQRAAVRATDENVPRALSGYRPSVTASGSLGTTYSTGVTNTSILGGNADFRRDLFPGSLGITVTQNLFNGFRTANSVRQAESQVFGARETLRNTEQTTLFNGAQSYMNVLRDTAILDLQRNNVEVLEEQLRQTRDRFNVGEVTRTDVAQAESRLAAARSQVSVAEGNLQTSIAVYRQVVGVEPRQLAPGRPIDRLVPRTLAAAVQIGLEEHPAVISALHAVDVAELQVKVTEGELAPTLNVVGQFNQAFETSFPGDQTTSAAIAGQISVPIYTGGEVYARVRQAKETAGQRRIEAESTRDSVRAAVISSWGQLESAKATVQAAQAQVAAAEVALTGVREEARVGQRTTLDVLNQQQELLNARVNLITAQRDRVVASFSVVQSIGRLSAQSLGLRTTLYSAKQHFDQVKDLPWGLRTPDGR
ncbi:TolC family outer membrane protein [Enterovirga sp. CN4-39]|uniref:TolC family outer membrane protein n=1 Tax=Enterovirga sp. CN4-39 TaxID=3400910 RepID=UPI003C056086